MYIKHGLHELFSLFRIFISASSPHFSCTSNYWRHFHTLETKDCYTERVSGQNRLNDWIETSISLLGIMKIFQIY